MKTLRNVLLVLVVTSAVLAAADAELLAFIGPDVKMVAGINVAQSKSSPFGLFLLSQMKAEDKDFQAFVGLTQFDPRRDLAELIVGATGSGDRKGGLVAVRGVFNVSAITSLAQSKGAGIDTYAGASLLLPAKTQSKKNGAVAFVGDSIAIAGDLDSVKAALDRRQKALSLDPRLAATVAELSSLYDAWVVSSIPVAEMATHVPDANVSGAMKGNALQSILQISGGLSFGDVVKITAEALTRSDKDATALADVIRLLASLVQMNRQAGQAAPLATALDHMDLRAEGSVTKVSLEMPEDQLEKLILSHPKPAHIHKTAAAH